MKLKVVLEPSDEGGFTVFVRPSRVHQRRGDTRDEALANIREAIDLYLEPVEDGRGFFPGGRGTRGRRMSRFLAFRSRMSFAASQRAGWDVVRQKGKPCRAKSTTPSEVSNSPFRPPPHPRGRRSSIPNSSRVDRPASSTLQFFSEVIGESNKRIT